jgi:hypothetical protein
MKINEKTAYKDAYSSKKDEVPEFIKEHEVQMKKDCF